jgi:hypothetical protein
VDRGLGPLFSPGQLDFLEDLLNEVLVFEPEKRISAAEVVRRLNATSSIFIQSTGNAEGISDGDGDTQQ